MWDLVKYLFVWLSLWWLVLQAAKALESKDGPVSEDLQNKYRAWLRKESQGASADIAAHYFDSVFGRKFLSWRRFKATCVVSFVVVALLLLAGWLLFGDEVFANIWGENWWHRTMVVVLFVLLNLCIDFISFAETRAVIGFISRRGGGRPAWFLGVVLDIALTSLLAIAGYTLALVGSFAIYQAASSSTVLANSVWGADVLVDGVELAIVERASPTPPTAGEEVGKVEGNLVRVIRDGKVARPPWHIYLLPGSVPVGDGDELFLHRDGSSIFIRDSDGNPVHVDVKTKGMRTPNAYWSLLPAVPRLMKHAVFESGIKSYTAVCVYSSFLTSAWLWLGILGSFALRLLRGFKRTVRVFNEKTPLQSTVVAAFLILSVAALVAVVVQLLAHSA